MAVRFAIASGDWNNTGIWDNVALPVAGDVVYSNGFSINVNQDININSLNTNGAPVYLPGMPIPMMTGNTQPNGIANAGVVSADAYKAFDQNSTTLWNSGSGVVGGVNSWISYQFDTQKIIKRYYIFRQNENIRPTGWIFQGSNNGSTWVDLEIVTSNTGTTAYLSGILPNTTAYFYYRINITTVALGSTVAIYTFEMTESILTSYGAGFGGNFTVGATLSGTRNITQTGAGIVGNGVLSLSHTGTNVVNLNTISGGYIVNPSWYIAGGGVAINHTGTGILNINGDLWGLQGTTGGYQLYSLQTTSSSTINIIGNLYSPRINNSVICNTINCSGAGAIYNITGNIIVTSIATTYFNQHAFYTVASNVTVNLTGNVTGNTGYGINHQGANGSVNVIGTITTFNNSSLSAIYTTASNTQIKISTPVINVGNLMAISSLRIILNNAYSNSWIFVDQTNTDRALTFGTPSGGAYPLEQDVRLGVTYAASPIRTGTCAVPIPTYVSQGVATGSSIGTAYLNAADVWNILTSTITVSGSIGERLKNASTVQTTGDQIASYQV